MSDYFLDSSALAKFYHGEVGTAKVEQIIGEFGANLFISRLTTIEIQSVFAGKVRSGVIAESQIDTLRNRFLNDLTARPLQVVAMTRFHFQVAEQLIRKHGQAEAFVLWMLYSCQQPCTSPRQVRLTISFAPTSVFASQLK